jgi:hypothetical protein
LALGLLRENQAASPVKAFNSTWQIQGYRHEVGDMGAWDEDSEEDLLSKILRIRTI